MIAQSLWWHMSTFSELTACTFPFFDLSIVFPSLSFNISSISVFDEGLSRWRLWYSGTVWSQGMLGVRAFGAVKGNRLNHAVKQVFTGLHYNVIFSPPLSFSILLPSESLDFFRLMIFDQREKRGYGLMIQYVLHVWELCIRRKMSLALKRCGGL